jgi:hypothetical protein
LLRCSMLAKPMVTSGQELEVPATLLATADELIE